MNESFLNYSNVGVLGQKVSFLGLISLEEKLEAIKLLNDSKILGMLKYFLELTGYLCNYIYFYTQLVAFLQALEIFLLRNALVNSQQRQTYAFKTKLEMPILQELASFQSI